MRSSADAVVIGAGALGASVAYHLAALGKRVSLLDRDEIASQSSPRAAGQTQQVRFDPFTTELAKESVRKVLRFTAETGEPLTYHQSGGVKLAHEPRWAAQIHQEVERGHAYGVEIELISPAEARRLAPWVVPDAALAIWYAPTDLYLEPRELPLGYARAATRLGAEVLPHTTVTGLRTRAGAVEAVLTDRGEIVTAAVVDAAGAWAGVVAAMTGIRVPIVPTRHQLYITKPLPGVLADQPIVRLLRDGSVYVRPERGGLLFGGYEPDPVAVSFEALPPDFRIADLALDITPLRKLTDEVREQFPILQGAEIAELRGGLPTMTADGHHIFDEVPGVRGFLIATGCCVGALSISPAVGEVFAHWVVDGKPPLDMSWFRLSRFGPEFDSSERLRQACLWRYAHHYETPVLSGEGGGATA